MKQSEIKNLLQEKYNQNNWKKFLGQTFGGAELFPTPKKLTDINPDVAKEACQLGFIKLDENGIERSIAVYDVTLRSSIVIKHNRVGLRNLLRKYWKNIDAAFIVYHYNDNSNWRFTYVSELKGFDADGVLVNLTTDSKRYTYILGEGESCRTAAERFAEIEKRKNEVTLDFLLNLSQKNFSINIKYITKGLSKNLKILILKFRLLTAMKKKSVIL